MTIEEAVGLVLESTTLDTQGAVAVLDMGAPVKITNLADDLITALSRFRTFAVLGRSASFAYKNRSVDTRQIVTELGVSYVLEGSVRRAGDRLRISAQFADGSSGASPWAQQFDGTAQDLDDLQPDEVERLKEAIATADAILVATPEFNGSIPGQLKNAFDWVSRPLVENPIRSKPVAVIGASTSSFGGIWAQRELKKVLGIMGARVLEAELPVAKADVRLADPDPELRDELASVVQALTAAAMPSRAEAVSF